MPKEKERFLGAEQARKVVIDNKDAMQPLGHRMRNTMCVLTMSLPSAFATQALTEKAALQRQCIETILEDLAAVGL